MIYPRIYSLSTLNIIHHHNCDYLFHSLRTDFTGESGSGKSMISDILQLILVGPSAYESSTYAYGDRKPQGMVLKKNGTGYGYIFSNIEIRKGEFIAIGSYIEAGSGTVFNFIMQKGYDWVETLEPVQNPIFHQHLIKENSILPFEQLKDFLSGIGVNIKKLSIAKYHGVLFKNEILPIDLSLSDKTLKNYALILRSFSRGKVFEKKSDNLKEFLFGDEKEKQLKKEFEEDVRSVQEDLENHKSLKAEIELINKAETTLNELSELHCIYKSKEKKYYHTKICYWEFQKKKIEDDLLSKSNEYTTIYSELYWLEIEQLTGTLNYINSQIQKLGELQSQLSMLTGQETALLERKKTTEYIYFDYKKKKEVLDQFRQILEERGVSVKEIEADLLRNIEYEQLKKEVYRFEKHLRENDIFEDFKRGDWSTNYAGAKQTAAKRIAEIDAIVSEYKSLSTFTDIENKESLANWAIDFFKRPLNREEESVLVYFQKLPRKDENHRNERHLPFPEELFNNLDIKEVSTKGFWLNLDGVFEFVTYVQRQILDTDINSKKLKEIQKLAGNITQEIAKAEGEKLQIETILKGLDSYSNVQNAINVYQKKEKILAYKTTLPDDISLEKLNSYYSISTKKEEIETSLPKVEKDADDAAYAYINYNTTVTSLNKDLDEIKTYLTQLSQTSLNLYLDKLTLQINNKKHELDLFKKTYNFPEEQLNVIRRKLENEYGDLQTHNIDIQNAIIDKTSRKKELDIEIGNLRTSREKATVTFANSQIDFKILVGEEYKLGMDPIPEPIENPDETLKEEYSAAKLLYEAKFQTAASGLEDNVILSQSFHLGKLASAMLPTVFRSNRIEETTIRSKIAEKLNELNHRASSISERKIEILSTVFSKVYDTYSDYLETINQIKNYFKGENKRITGGNRVSLTYNKSGDFPEGWLTPFRKKLDAELMNTGLFASLAKELDIYDMMLKAFKESGGSSKVTATELLNPKSYFDLSFDLKLENNISNDGSTGQTYAATALLGIARLSIVENALHGKRRKGIRFMPVDEAEGLGGNYNMLYEIAKEEGYQLISMSIEPVGYFMEGQQYIYILNENPIASNEYNPPFAIFSASNIIENIDEFISQKHK